MNQIILKAPTRYEPYTWGMYEGSLKVGERRWKQENDGLVSKNGN